MSDLDLNAPVRPGSIDTKADEVEKFPYEAFEFESPQVVDTCLLTLLSGWNFETKGDLSVGGDVSIGTNLTVGGITTLSGSLNLNANTVATNYTVLDGDGYKTILINGAHTITLPASANNAGRILTIVQIGSGEATVTRAGSDTINGLTSVYLNNAYQKVTVQCIGDVWYVISGEVTAVSGSRAIADEFIFDEDSELDYSASFTDGMAAATVTFSELPSNTCEILVGINFADPDADVRLALSRSSGGTQQFSVRGAFSDGGTNRLYGMYWLPTSGNSIYVRVVTASTTSSFIIYGYKVK